MWKPTFDQAGSYDVVVSVSDGDLTATSRTTIVVVENVNRPPVFVNQMADVTVPENVELTFTYVAVDPDAGAVLTYSLVNPPAGAVIDPVTGVFTWTLTFLQAGVYDIVVVVTDGDLSATSATAVVTVQNVNNEPYFTMVMDDTTVVEGQELVFTFAAADINGDALTFSLVNGPAGAVIDPVTGVFTWIPAYDQSGAHVFRVAVSDGEFTVMTPHIIVIVGNTNLAPNFLSVLPADTTINEGQQLVWQFTAEDPYVKGSAVKKPNTVKASLLVYSLVNPPAGATINAASGYFEWTPTYVQAGDYEIVAVVTDGELSDTASSVVHVLNINLAPHFVNTVPDITIQQGQQFNFTYTAVDPDAGTTLVFAGDTLPDGATMNAATGKFTWTPSYTQLGDYNVVVSVTDGEFVVVDSAVITVSKVNVAPVFTDILKDTTIVADSSTLIFKYKAADANNDPLTFSFVGTYPASMTLSATLGTFRFKPLKAETGIYTVILRVSDGSLFDLDTVVVTVRPRWSAVDNEESGIPTKYTLKQNFPNPFNPSTRIKYAIPEESKVIVRIFNLLGQEVATLVNEVQTAGNYYVDFNASSLTSGIYLYSIEAKNYKSVRKMNLIK